MSLCSKYSWTWLCQLQNIQNKYNLWQEVADIKKCEDYKCFESTDTVRVRPDSCSADNIPNMCALVWKHWELLVDPV